ncbi:hypothetical protein CEXT_671551 [Caerostris extrusa]|uniref:Uncharacterized protein n=1 Tax=Caerostris extrusa TaxID=172846 RepID=A0AAV4TF54_CAEEX|nr:hypothetical protein CEXT_671551 [Caerostris extrusa]
MHTTLERKNFLLAIIAAYIENSSLFSLTCRRTHKQRKPLRDNILTWCFAEDADDLENVRRVANAIRSATNHGRIMYYKTNAASANRLFHEDTTAICKYMHSVKGQLFRRDEYKRWEMV